MSTATGDPLAAAREQRDLVVDEPAARPQPPLKYSRQPGGAARATPQRWRGTIRSSRPSP